MIDGDVVSEHALDHIECLCCEAYEPAALLEDDYARGDGSGDGADHELAISG